MKNKQAVQWVERLTYDQMVSVIDQLLNPKHSDPTQEQVIYNLDLFCANCPDPSGAMDVVIETPSPTTAQEIVNRAMSLPAKDVADVPTTKLAASHPLRFMRPK